MREQTLARLITDMPDDELRAARHDAATGLSLLRPGSPMYGPAHAYLGLLDAELAQRHAAGHAASPGTWHDTRSPSAAIRQPAATGRDDGSPASGPLPER
jgi:hypothetical protein